MKKDLVIKLLQKIQKNNLSIEDSKSLFNRSEKLLATILSGGDFKNNVDIINSYNSDEVALKAVKIYLSVDPTNSMTPSKKRLTLELLTNQTLINSGKVFEYVQCFLDIPDEKYENCYIVFFNLLLDDYLITQELNFTFANFIIEHGFKSSPYYLEKLFSDEKITKQNSNIILNRALVITQASCQNSNNLSSMINFFSKTNLDNEEIILNCARIIGNSSKNSREVCDLFLEAFPKHLSKCDYYLKAGKIIGALKSNIGYCVARDAIKADSNFEDKNTILLLRILKDCSFESLGYGYYDVHYGNVIFRCNGDSIASNIISKIIDTNYAYYYMLEKSVSDSKNNDINVSDLSVKLTRIKNDATKI